MNRVLIVVLFVGISPACAAQPPAAARPSDEPIRRLIASLGDNNYFVRQKAERELEKLGFEAVEELAAAADSDDMEIVARSERLLRTIKSNWVKPGDPPTVVQALSEFEALDDANREGRVATLIGLPDRQGVPAVCRVICYDRSLLLAKAVAVRLLESLSGEMVKPEVATEIRTNLAGSRRGARLRAPVRWVLSWLDAGQNPGELAAVWSKIAAEESDLLLRRPRETSPAIVESLLQIQITALRNAHRGEAAAESFQRLVKLHRGDPAALTKLLQWLTEQKDWAATRMVEEQFRATIASSSDLLYLMAEAQYLRGDVPAAEQSAAKALKLNPEIDDHSMELHFMAGHSLEARGRYAWAIREWDYVVRNAPPESRLGIVAAHFLSELYHDLEEDDHAAATLLRVEKAHTARSNLFRLSEDEESASLGELRARRRYFEACHWRDAGDRAKQRAALDAALNTQAYDIEVLIECYRFPDSSPDYRDKIRTLIQKKLCELREQIGDNAAAQPCNEFAWLVANTEGDLNEALRYSKRSLELAGENGAFRDTLARVYEVKGDLDEAIKQQTAAAALSPHTRAITKQLEVLRAKAAQRKGNPKSESRNTKQIGNLKSE